MASIDRQTAALRWPQYDVVGKGRCAVVIECQRRVVLVESPLEANAVAGQSCGQGCSHVVNPYGNWHKQRTLDRGQTYCAGTLAALMED